MPTGKRITVSEQHLREIIEDAVRAAVRREFFDAGLQLHDPKDRLASRDDFGFLRKARLRFEKSSSHIGKTVLTAVIMAVIGLFVAGLKMLGVKIDM
jgi:hypothetical protein